jgi:hypothetical protein
VGDYSAQDLLRDPEYLARVEASNRRVESEDEALLKEQRPVIDDLRKIGFDIDELDDLTSFDSYSDAFPVLLRYLKSGVSDGLRANIAMVLGVAEAEPYWRDILESYRATSLHDFEPKEALAAALAAAGGERHVDEIIDLLAEEEVHGESLGFLLEPLAKSRTSRGREILESLRSHPQFGEEAEILLKNKKRPR